MSDRYTIGEATRLSVAVLDANDQPIDPAVLVLKIKPPGAAILTVPADDIANDAVGAYHYDCQLTTRGTWYYRWESGDPIVAVAEGSVTAQPSRFT